MIINSIVKAIVVAGTETNPVIRDLETNEIIDFNTSSNQHYVPGEYLEIRVETIENSFIAGEKRKISGKVLVSDIRPEYLKFSPVEVVRVGDWNPDELYGKELTRRLFPFHKNKTYSIIDFTRKNALDEIDESKEYASHEVFNSLLKAFSEKNLQLQSMFLMGSFYLFDKKDVNTGMKYFKMLEAIVEHIVPEEMRDFVIFDKRSEASFYLAALSSIGNCYWILEEKEKALQYLKKCLQINPIDSLNVRRIIYKITGEKFMNLDPNVSLDPYAYYSEYKLPVRDSYDPDRKIRPLKWLNMTNHYKRILIWRFHLTLRNWSFLPKREQLYHVDQHLAIEDEVASPIGQDVRKELARLVARGLSRHEAIHVLFEILDEEK